MTKWAAFGATSYLVNKNRERLSERLPDRLLDTAQGFGARLDTKRERELVGEFEDAVIFETGQGGVFGCLWQLGSSLKTGLSVSLERIPIRQETVEVCNILDVNPYTADGSGNLLIACSAGERVAERLRQEGHSAAVIGRTVAGNDRVVRLKDGVRFLERVDSLPEPF